MYQSLASLYPDRISVRVEKKVPFETSWSDKLYKKAIQAEKGKNSPSPASLANLQLQKSSWKMSSQSRHKLQDSCQLLDQLAVARTVWPSKKKPIYNFRNSFVTLTLPSPQLHTDVEIKSKCLNQFLTIMRQKFGLRNYVWKAELQKNESIHFHIIWDLYIHHKAVRYYWNQALELLGYVTEYQNKFCNMSLQTYANYRGLAIPEAVNAFRTGRDTLWKSPGTEQVVAVRSSKQLAMYLRKYLVKDAKKMEEEISKMDEKSRREYEERCHNFGRVWARSQSLSRIKFTTRYDWDNLLQYIKTLGQLDKNFYTVVYDYCTVYYINFQTAETRFINWLKSKIIDLGTTYNYLPSGV